MGYLLRVLPLAILLALLSLPLVMGARKHGRGEGARRLLVRVYLTSPGDQQRLHQLGIEDVVLQGDQYVDLNVTGEELLALRQAGMEVALVVEIDTSGTAPHDWPQLEELEGRLERLAAAHPEICRKWQIGTSAYWNFPIWALKISDNVNVDEDEPRVLVNGGIHAREPLSIAACMYLAERLCEDYLLDPKVRSWVDELEIYIVPVLNPDGYHYVVSQGIRFPWWRKNLADNDGDGRFNPEADGVDLNRNFAFNWQNGGSDDPSSWFYRGPRPFSEPETRAFRDLALQVRPVAGISFHSCGEAVLFPWSNYVRPVDLDLLEHMAFQMASVLEKRARGESYSVMPLNGRVGQSSCWLYAALGCFDFTVEVGDEYFPEMARVPRLARTAVKAAYFLFDRVRGSGLWLRVVDAVTRVPLLAEVRVLELGEGPGAVRRTDPFLGRLRWLLDPGRYRVSVAALNHVGVTRVVEIEPGKPTEVLVELAPSAQTVPLGNE